MKYKLVKLYPGCLHDIGTVVEKGYVGYVPEGNSKNLGTWYVPYFHVEAFPEFWEPVVEEIELTAEHLASLVKIDSFRFEYKVGQNINDVDSAARLSCKELKINIECGYYRSMLHNKDKCLNLLLNFANSLSKETKLHYYNLWKEQQKLSNENNI